VTIHRCKADHIQVHEICTFAHNPVTILISNAREPCLSRTKEAQPITARSDNTNTKGLEKTKKASHATLQNAAISRSVSGNSACKAKAKTGRDVIGDLLMIPDPLSFSAVFRYTSICAALM
jgi:hypothetical protein